ncbi:MAG TPA: hypothetical protein VGX96_19375, partial [Candidatus Elarobacter sp.]|nr:hypothetical protein [Candidatus Elarobacter sp.]
MIGRSVGAVVATRGHLVEAELPFARIGDGVRVCARDVAVNARVVAVSAGAARAHETRALLAPFGSLAGVASGDRVESDPSVLALPLGTPLLGRAIDAAGDPLDGQPVPRGARVAVAVPLQALSERRPCTELFRTGVRAIDGPLAFGRGARIGVFGSPGSGKSSLLDAIVRGADADAVVIGLIGERGREAERRIAALDERSTIVCA